MSKFVVLVPFSISKPFMTPVYSQNYVISYLLIKVNFLCLFLPLQFFTNTKFAKFNTNLSKPFSKSLFFSLKNLKLFQLLWLPRKQFTCPKSTIKTLEKSVKYD